MKDLGKSPNNKRDDYDPPRLLCDHFGGHALNFCHLSLSGTTPKPRTHANERSALGDGAAFALLTAVDSDFIDMLLYPSPVELGCLAMAPMEPLVRGWGRIYVRLLADSTSTIEPKPGR